jgi:hypothetical protein
MQALTRLFSSSSVGADAMAAAVPSSGELIALIEGTCPKLIDHQRILSQTRYEPRTRVYPPAQKEEVPMTYLRAHLGLLHQHVDLICVKYPHDVAMKMIYGLGEFTGIGANEFNCEYIWREGVFSEGGSGQPMSTYKTHCIADELPIITWLIACRTMIEGIKFTSPPPPMSTTTMQPSPVPREESLIGGVNVSGAVGKFAEAVKLFESHSLLAKKAGHGLYYGRDAAAPPQFARAYMGKAFAFVCRAFHQMCYAEIKRLTNKFHKDLVYHMHFYYSYMDKATSLMQSVHTRDGAATALYSHVWGVQRNASLHWYEFYLALNLYFDEQHNLAWAFDEMNAAMGGITEPAAYAYMRQIRDELEGDGKSMTATGPLFRNIRYVVNTKIVNRRRIPHRTFDDEPMFQL